jgi:glycosyltransferase involved in cell wall biosynthesis
MKVLHVIVALHRGGAELMMKRLIMPGADQAGIEHRVIALRDTSGLGPELEAAGIRVDALGLGGPADLVRALTRLRRLMRDFAPDVVQTWMYHADLLGGLAARSVGIRNVVWGVRIADIAVEMGVSRSTLWIRRICAALSRRIPVRIVYVAASARTVHESLGYAHDRGLVIPNGYAMPPARDEITAAAVREELAIPRDAIVIASAGRYNAQKDHRSFVAAGTLLAQRYPHAHFLMVGRGVDSANEELMEWVRASGHADRFRVVGERRDLARAFAAADIFCLHSIGEGFPNVVAEAMAVGLPCAVTDVGDAALIVGELGEVVTPRAPAAMADALARLIDIGPERRGALGLAARQHIASAYSLEAIRARYRTFYEGLTDIARPTPDPASSAGSAELV